MDENGRILGDDRFENGSEDDSKVIQQIEKSCLPLEYVTTTWMGNVIRQSEVLARVKNLVSQSPRLSNSLAWLLSFATESGRRNRRTGYYERLHREEFFYKCTRFLAYNMIQGDYLEFGCCGGTTFRLAHKYAHFHELKMHLYGFDSFEGLPAPKGIDDHPQWKKGAMSFGIEKFEKILKPAGAKKSEYTLMPGYYSDSLSGLSLDKLNLKSAALIYVDCDLYESTVPVLDFVLPLLQTGTVVAFDDFYCFNGDPGRGEQLALREFLQRNPEIEFVNYLNFAWSGKSFIVKKNVGKANREGKKEKGLIPVPKPSN